MTQTRPGVIASCARRDEAISLRALAAVPRFVALRIVVPSFIEAKLKTL